MRYEELLRRNTDLQNENRMLQNEIADLRGNFWFEEKKDKKG